MTPLDLSVPSSLMMAIIPELVIMGGAMLLLVWAGWDPLESTCRHASLSIL